MQEPILAPVGIPLALKLEMQEPIFALRSSMSFTGIWVAILTTTIIPRIPQATFFGPEMKETSIITSKISL